MGICAAVERVSWGVWDGYEVALAPRNYVRALQRAGAIATDPAARPGRGRRPRRAARPDRRAAPRGRRRHRPGELRRGAAPGDEGDLARARRLRAGADPAGARARHAGARDLPRDAADQRGDGRDARPAPARVDRRRPPPLDRRELRHPPGAAGRGDARLRGRRDRRTARDVPPPPGRGEGGRGPDRQRLVGRRRHRRGDRAPRPPLRPRRRLAPRGGRDERDHPGAGRGRAGAGRLS